MKIAVCVNHVPDTATKVKVSPDEKNIDQAGVTYVFNPYDEFAVEEALKLKEQLNSEVIIISVGGDRNKETVRKALAMGADRGILIKDDSIRDSFGIAKALTEEIKTEGCELVLMGKQSVDYDNSGVGQMTAELLGYQCVTVAVSLKIEGAKLTVEREIEGGKEVVESELPAVITAQKGLNEPRYASLKGIMAAKKKEIKEVTPAVSEVLTEVVNMKKPEAKQPGRILGTDSTAVPELVKLLREEAKVI